MPRRIDERGFYTVVEAARLLDVSPVTIWRWIEAGKLPAYRVGSRKLRIKKEDLESVITPARGKEVKAMERAGQHGEPATAAELTRRQALVGRILAKRKERDIAPLTTVDLVRKVREDEEEGRYGVP